LRVADARRLWLLVAGILWLALLAFDIDFIRRARPWPMAGDEWRYLYYAENLLQGFFSPTDRVFLWNGPGYPLLVAPFLKLDWPAGARYANALFHWGALGYAWLILRPRLGPAWALAASAALALYTPLYDFLPLVHTEVLCFFLVTAWVHHSLRAPGSRGHLVAAGCYLGFLCLTKVVFGYAVTALWLVTSAASLWWRWRRSPVLSATVRQTALALILCLPYLVYTHQLTGRVFYWSTSGPDSFYWLTSPSPHEWGDWYHFGWVRRNPTLHPYHGELFARLTGLQDNPHLSEQEQLFNFCTPQAGDVLMQRARQNIRDYPTRFARNWVANLARLFFDVPQSVRGGKFWNPYTRCHLVLLGWTLLVAILARRRRAPLPVAWLPIAGLGGLTFGLLTLSSGMARFLVPLVPLWWLTCCCWLASLARNPGRAAYAVPDAPGPPLSSPDNLIPSAR
jgi:hypothetical protein